MKLNYIDIHSHLNLSPLLENKEAILAKMQELGIGTITVGTTLETSKMAIQIAEQNEHCWATIGVHPCECSIPSPTLPQGKGEAPGYLTGSGVQLESLLMKAKEMRSEPTPAEDELWQYLKGDKMGYHFRRQHIIDRFIVDFVCLDQELVVEVDGDVHSDLQVRDNERTGILESLGFSVIRFSNDEVINEIENVLQKIKESLERKILPLGEDLGGDFEKLANHPKVVAIGETGLDYFRDQSEETKQKQVELFKKHIELADKVGKPLMLHVRASKGTDDAYYDALQILKEFDPLHYRGEGGSAEQNRVRSANFHFFSGSKKCMEDIITAGFTISVDGPITFSHDYDEMIKAVPLDKLMIETDAPFAAPAPYRGSASWRTCEPWMVIEIAKKIAELKGIDLEVVQAQVLDNTAQFFALDF